MQIPDLASIVLDYTDSSYMTFERNLLEKAWQLRKQELVFSLASEYDPSVFKAILQLKTLWQELQDATGKCPLVSRFMTEMQAKEFTWEEALSPPCSMLQTTCYLNLSRYMFDHAGCCREQDMCSRLVCRPLCTCSEPIPAHFATPSFYWGGHFIGGGKILLEINPDIF